MTSDRTMLWQAAYRQWKKWAGSTKFLVGTIMDRQTGALVTDPRRKALGATTLAPHDRARLDTRSWDGISRRSVYKMGIRRLTTALAPTAERVRSGTYRPGILTASSWDKLDRDVEELRRQGIQPDWRTIYYPNELDKAPAAVLLEIIEPIVDPVLHPHQHAYRATRIAGQRISVHGYRSPQGSTDIVMERVRRSVHAGRTCLAYMDIRAAFDSVDRTRLRHMLVDDGCPEPFAREIIQVLGTSAYGHWLPGPKGTPNVKLTGIPLGSPVGPLLFNFFVRSVHLDPTREQVMAGYADDLLVTASTREKLDEVVSEVLARLDDLGLECRVDISDLRDGAPRWALGWEMILPPGSKKLIVKKVPKRERGGVEAVSLSPGGVGGDAPVVGGGLATALGGLSRPRATSNGDATAASSVDLSISLVSAKDIPESTDPGSRSGVEGIRHGQDRRPPQGEEPHLRQGSSDPTVCASHHPQAASSAQTGHRDACGVPVLVLTPDFDADAFEPKGEELIVVPAGQASHLVRSWRRLSRVWRRPLRARVRHTQVDMLHHPGLFGQPDQLGGSGDHHWRRGRVEFVGDHLELHLHRLGPKTALGWRHHLRGGTPFVLAVPVRAGDRFWGLALPRHPYGAAAAVSTRPYANATSAVARAAAKALSRMRGDVAVITSQPLNAETTKTPEIAIALEGLHAQVAQRDAPVRYVQVARSGGIVQECVRVWTALRFRDPDRKPVPVRVSAGR